MKKENTQFILVHGAWQGSWAWDDIEPFLNDNNFTSYSFDLPGSGNDKEDLNFVTLEKYAEKIITETKNLPPGRKILVGHSMGGAAVTVAAIKEPELFDKVIYICAFLPQEGESVLSLGSQTNIVDFSGPQYSLINNNQQSKLIQETIAETFFNDMPEKNTNPYTSRFGKQALPPLLTAIPEWSESFKALKKYYIVCTADKAVPTDLQHSMAAAAGINPIEINSGHEPFISMPGELSVLLKDLSK